MVESGLIEFLVILALAVAALGLLHIIQHLMAEIYHSFTRMKIHRPYSG